MQTNENILAIEKLRQEITKEYDKQINSILKEMNELRAEQEKLRHEYKHDVNTLQEKWIEMDKRFIRLEIQLENIKEQFQKQYENIEEYMQKSLEYLQETNNRKDTALINSLSIKDKVFIGVILAFIGFKEPILALFGL